jgi:hypothetical protein
MKNGPGNWLEETWEIKKRIARETKNMSFREYWNYIVQLSTVAKKQFKNLQKKTTKGIKFFGKT